MPKQMTDSTKKLVEECNDLMIRFKSGDEGAYSELYHTTLTYVYNVIKQKGLTNEDVEDISQEVYLKIYTNAKSLEDTKSTLRWIKTIAVNTANDHFKKKGVIHETTFETEDSFLMFEESDLIAPIEMPEDVFEKKETRELLNRFIGELPETQQICAKERFFNELQLKEIAEKYGIPEGTVKTNTFKARNNLQNKIIVYSKKYGVKLCAIPIFALFFGLYSEKASAAEIPAKASANILAGINKALGKGIIKSVVDATSQASTINATGVVAKTTVLGAKKITAIVIGVAAVAGVTTGVAVYNSNNGENNNETSAVESEMVTTKEEPTTIKSELDLLRESIEAGPDEAEEVVHLINGDFYPSELVRNSWIYTGHMWNNDIAVLQGEAVANIYDYFGGGFDQPWAKIRAEKVFGYTYSEALQEDSQVYHDEAIFSRDPNAQTAPGKMGAWNGYFLADIIYGDSKYKTGDWYHDFVTLWEEANSNNYWSITPFTYKGEPYMAVEFTG